MCMIKLTKGRIATVSGSDYCYLSQFSWFVLGGYAAREVQLNYNRTIIFMHHVVAERMGWKVRKGQIDHQNRKRTDNRRSNLRQITLSQQSRNTSYPLGESGVRGVCRNGNGWRGYLTDTKIRHYTGTYPTIQQAAKARRALERYYGI